MSALRLMQVRATMVRACTRANTAALVAAPCAAAARASLCNARSASLPLRFTCVRSFHSSFLRHSDGASSAAPLSSSEVTSRVLSVIRKFEKVDPAKVSETASFARDLGLDSLDGVEVTMALEDEFGIEIPDAEADKIQSVADAIKYISGNPKAQ